jgi:hypothetical protein
MKNPKVAVVLAIIAVAVLGFGGFKFFKWYQGEEVEYVLKCKDSGEIFTMKLPSNTAFPYENPKTKTKSLYKADRYYDTVTKKNVYMIVEFEEIPPTMRPGGEDSAVKDAVTPDKPVVEEPKEE